MQSSIVDVPTPTFATSGTWAKLAFGIALHALAGCAPGSLAECTGGGFDCYKGGAGALGGGAGTGGQGGTPAANPYTCMMYLTKEEAEEKLVLARCGNPANATCHARAGAAFPPVIAKVGEIVPNVLDKKPTLSCTGNGVTEKFVDRANPEKSFFLAKVRAGDAPAVARCPSANKEVGGGSRMPYTPEMRLTEDEINCLGWWIFEIAK